MKKIMTILLSAALCVGMLAGCGKSAGTASGDSIKMKDGETTQTVVQKISDEIGVQMPGELNDQILKDLFYIDAVNCEEYFGVMSMTMTSADNIVAVKAKPEQKQQVVDGLTKRLADVKTTFEQYLPDQKEKVDRAKVIEKGDYVFLLILGSEVDQFDAEMEKATGIVDGAFA